MKVSLILTCAGKGLRTGLKQNKILYHIGGKTLLDKTVESFVNSKLIDEIIITANETDIETIKKAYPLYKVVLGGATRSLSIYNALKEVTGDITLISDGARPFVSKKIIEDCILCAEKYGSAVPVLPERNTVIYGDGKVIDKYLGKDKIYQVQTPQGFKTELIVSAYEYQKGKSFNDDGEVYKNLYGTVYTFLGDEKNVKITYPEDLKLLSSPYDVRFGTGFDCHKLTEERKLVLGGIEIPFDKGLLGHSDADVLTHAIMDAILSGAGLKDIGYYFPDNDIKYKDARSTDLLKEVLRLCSDKGYKPTSVSAVIMAEKPKLAPYIDRIKENLADLLNIPVDNLGITATTLEGLGFVGREEGICVKATAVLIKQ